MRSTLIIVFTIFQFFGAGTLLAQITINGVVSEKETGEPIPFANVVFPHTTIGTITDIDGRYTLKTQSPGDSLMATCLGFAPHKTVLNNVPLQTINFELESNTTQIEEVIVTPGPNPAFRILDSIKLYRKKNNPQRFSSYSYNAYSKLRLDLNNIDQFFKDQRLMKQFQFVFENMDSSEVFEKNYLPILISESVSRYYFQKNPSVEKEVIEAFKISGIENNTISQFSGKMYQQLNIYENFIQLFEPGFVSPIADFGRMYYKYHLEDSTFLDGKHCYKIEFQPKRKKERTFYGYFWVADTSWAIKKIQLRVSKDVNINFMNDLIAVNEYQQLNDTTWFLSSEEMIIDFNLYDQSYGFFGRKEAKYTDVSINTPIPEEVKELRTNTYYDEEQIEKDDEFWEENRKSELSNEDADIYTMVDSVKKVPMYRTIYGLIEMLYEGYYDVGKFAIGPYYTFYSYNPIEGTRIRFGGRTSMELSENYRVGGFGAYGFGDEQFKYGINGEVLFDKNPRKGLSAEHYHDIRQLGKSSNALLDDNIMYSILRRRPNYKLSMVDYSRISYEHEWFQGFTNELQLSHAQVFSNEYVPFQSISTGGDTLYHPSVTATEITLKTHFAYQEKFILGKFEQHSLGSIYPILDLELSYSPKGLINSEYEYFKIKASISDKIEVNPLGYTKYRLVGGKIFGTVPYPLLELHEGNETYAYDRLAFNMMNYYEFASDEYASLWVEHHFQGFFLNRIPLIRLLEFREVLSAKMLVGRLSEKNQNVLLFPDNLNWLNDVSLDRDNDIRILGIKPYMEVGVGVENILKLFRVEATWRLAYRSNPDIQKFGLRIAMQITF